VIFGRFDADRFDDFIRYPVVIRLDNYQLTIQLPTRAKAHENKEKEIHFVGHREYLLNGEDLVSIVIIHRDDVLL
jgi:hypothetical protein